MEQSAVDAWASFLASVEQARTQLKCSRSGAFWRGHSNAQHTLIPTLLRAVSKTGEPHSDEKVQGIERDLYSECFVRAHGLLASSRSSWEALALLQHYGIPTRLLDWTETFGVALFFALARAPKPDSRPCLWLLNPYRMNVASGVSATPRIVTIGVDPLTDYFESFINYEHPAAWPHAHPVFIEVPWTNARINAQRGYFTVHRSAQPLELQSPSVVRRLDIPDAAIPGARRFLELAGINQYSVFPDLEGLGQFLRSKYNY